MAWYNRLKRSVASGSAVGSSGRGERPDAEARRTSHRFALHGLTRELIELAWPIAAAMMGETFMGLVDTKLIGHLGKDALGGVGMAIVLMYLSYSLVYGMMRGVKVRVAWAIGQGRPGDAVVYAEAGVWIGALIGAAVFVVARDATSVLRALRVEESTVAYARDFLSARTEAAVATCALTALIQWRQGVGDSRSPMIVGLAGNALSAVLAYALVNGKLGAPALGVRGAGYATSITETLEFACMGAMLLSARAKAPKYRVSMRVAMREVLGLGGPTAVHFALETLAFTSFTAVLASIGAAEIAAHLVALNVVRASFLPGAGLGEAASVLVARSLGRGSMKEAERVTRSALATAIAFMTFCGVVLAIFGRPIARAFTDDPEVVRIAGRLLFVAAIFQTLDACNIVLRGALRGAKDVTYVMFAGTTIVWCCLPGVAYVLGRVMGMGAVGGWCGFIAETTLATIVFLRRWRRGAWRSAFEARASTPNDRLEMAPALAAEG